MEQRRSLRTSRQSEEPKKPKRQSESEERIESLLRGGERYALHVHDPHHQELTEGDLDDLMTIEFILFLMNNGELGKTETIKEVDYLKKITKLVVYLTNDNPENFVKFYPNLILDNLIFICRTSRVNYNELVKKAEYVGIMAPLKNGEDQEIIDAILQNPTGKDYFSQGHPVTAPGAHPSYNFKKLNEDTAKEFNEIIKHQYGESTKINPTILGNFMTEDEIDAVMKFALLRFLGMPMGKFAAGLVSERFGRGNNLKGLLNIISQVEYGDRPESPRLLVEYESNVAVMDKLLFVKELVKNRRVIPMIENYYSDFLRANPDFKDTNFVFLDGLKVLSWFYELVIVTEFEKMPTISLGSNFEIRKNFVQDLPFSYDLNATMRFLSENYYISFELGNFFLN